MSNVTQTEQPITPPPPVQTNTPVQPTRPSHRRYWVVLAIVSGIILVGGIILVVGLSIFTAALLQPVASPVIVTDQYLSAIKSQNYTKAYTYWDPNVSPVFSEQQFTRSARMQDDANGSVVRYGIGPEVPQRVDNTAIVRATVTRSNGKVFDMELRLRQVSGEWKIFSSTTQAK